MFKMSYAIFHKKQGQLRRFHEPETFTYEEDILLHVNEQKYNLKKEDVFLGLVVKYDAIEEIGMLDIEPFQKSLYTKAQDILTNYNVEFVNGVTFLREIK